jgi:predicted peptidase
MSQHPRSIETQLTLPVHLNYLLYLPKDYGEDKAKKWPAILFLHGAGERGDDLALLKKHGIPKLVEERSDFPFVTLSPQCPLNTWWVAESLMAGLDALLNDAVAQLAIDPNRIYLTGLSMGGMGCWQLAAQYPDRFAALVPICGPCPWGFGFPQRAAVLRHLPIWVFHGAKDMVVPLADSESIVKVLQAAGGNVRFTIYPDTEHDAWSETYDNPELYEWMLQHTRCKVT